MENSNMTINENKSKRKLIMLYIILALGIALMVFFSTALIINTVATRQGEAFYDTVAVEFIPRPTPLPTRVTPNTPSEQQIIDEIEEDVDEPILIDFDAMTEEIPDIIGWIQSEGTPINFPIVQGRDNFFYLNHLPNRQRNHLGSIFMDYRNAPDFTNLITKIYGHNTPNGTMFGTLRQYSSQQFFEDHHSMFIFTPDQNYELVLFAGYTLDSAFEVPPMSFANSESFYEFIDNIRRRSIFSSELEITFGDRLVLLATCTSGGLESERLIIVGKLVNII